MDYWLKCLFKWKFNRKNILSSLTYEYYFFEGSGNYKDEIIKKYFNVYFINGKLNYYLLILYVMMIFLLIIFLL